MGSRTLDLDVAVLVLPLVGGFEEDGADEAHDGVLTDRGSEYYGNPSETSA